MLHFYRDVLHCEVERELPELGLVQLRAGEALIDIVPVESELGKLGGRPPTQNGRNVDHICLKIAALAEDDIRNYLASFAINTPEFSERYGAEGFGRSVYINDPEGNVIELKIAKPSE